MKSDLDITLYSLRNLVQNIRCFCERYNFVLRTLIPFDPAFLSIPLALLQCLVADRFRHFDYFGLLLRRFECRQVSRRHLRRDGSTRRSHLLRHHRRLLLRNLHHVPHYHRCVCARVNG